MGVHQTRTLASLDANFQQTIKDAIEIAATNIYNESTKLTANVRSGTANPTFAFTPALTAPIPAGTVIKVGSELFLSTAGALTGATTIATTTTATQDHVVGEALAPPSPAHHYERAIYARQILTNPDQYVVPWAVALAAQGLSAASTDAAVDTGISSAWDAMAGA